MLGIFYAFWGMDCSYLCKKDPFFLPRVMWAKFSVQGLALEGLRLEGPSTEMMWFDLPKYYDLGGFRYLKP